MLDFFMSRFVIGFFDFAVGLTRESEKRLSEDPSGIRDSRESSQLLFSFI